MKRIAKARDGEYVAKHEKALTQPQSAPEHTPRRI
jgi:hypothetical protein